VALTRDSALLATIAEVVDISSVQDLANLEADSEFSTADSLLEAHRWVYDRLKRRFPTDALAVLTNQAELKRAVAYRFLEVLAAAGYISAGEGARAADEGARGYWGQEAREEVDSFVPEYSDDTEVPRASNEGVPYLTNVSKRPLFGGQLS